MFSVRGQQYDPLPNPSQLSSPFNTHPRHAGTSSIDSSSASFNNLNKSSRNGVYSVVSQVTDHDRGSAEISTTSSGRRRSTGWRRGALIAAGLACISLLLNVSVAIWIVVSRGYDGGISEVFRGDCKKVDSLNTWIHLLINALSTALLSGSNYCMQVLSAPTRKEVDKAHVQQKWLDIGVPSLRNLRSVSKKKVVVWWCLALSSIPLHLMYNSAFFSSISDNDFEILYVDKSFVHGASFNKQGFLPDEFDLQAVQDNLFNTSRYDALNNADCITAYAGDFLTNRRTLVIVAANDNTNEGGATGGGSLLSTDSFGLSTWTPSAQWNPNDWMCNDADFGKKFWIAPEDTGEYLNCYKYIPEILEKPELWAPDGYLAASCFSEKTEAVCGFHFNVVIIIVVAACNLCKAVCMLYVSFGINDDPFLTIGDAASSFLDIRDETTKGSCLATKASIKAKGRRRYGFGDWTKNSSRDDSGPTIWQPRKQRWFNSASKSRWLIFILFSAITIGGCGYLLWLALKYLPTSKSLKALYAMGMGQLHARMMIANWDVAKIKNATYRILASAMIANSPQVILSFLYLFVNSLCTSMFLADEWSHFATQRKTLRVSTPKGEQRKKYFLQLPYRIAVPLIAMSALLHWLVSQSLFLAVISEYDIFGNLLDAAGDATCAFSPIAIIFALLVGGIVLLSVIGLGFRQLDSRIPMVGSCSAAISAACHQPDWDCNASTASLLWGVVDGMRKEGGIDHCSLSSGAVSEPVRGCRYE